MNRDLFGDPIPEPVLDDKGKERKAPNNAAIRTHAGFISQYGTTPDQRCKNCALLGYKQFANKYFRCTMQSPQAIDAAGPANDWRANWQACGKFQFETP